MIWRVGTLFCILFGHKFIGRGIKYHPHYLELAKTGSVSMLTDSDWDYEWGPRNYCVRCGINREKN